MLKRTFVATCAVIATGLAVLTGVFASTAQAQDKLKAMDFDGAVADLDGVLAQDPTAFELGIALAVRGGVLFSVGDVDGAGGDDRSVETADQGGSRERRHRSGRYG